MTAGRPLTIGSLFSGYGGLDLAVEHVLGARTVWTSDVDPGACRILAARFPDAPNLGDITAVDWTRVEPVDVLTGGFPCQDVSHAGARKGLGPGTRSGLWSRMADAIDHLRPSLVIAENVRGLLSAAADSDVEPCPWCMGGAGDGEPPLRALGSVLADLAELGYDARWIGIRAADVGAPHGRFRVFLVAEPAGNAAVDAGDAGRVPVRGSAAGSTRAPRGAGDAAAVPDGVGRERPGRTRRVDAGPADGGRPAAADTGRVRRDAGRPAGPGGAEGRGARGVAAGRGVDAAPDPVGRGWDGRAPDAVGGPVGRAAAAGPSAGSDGGPAAPDAERGGVQRWGGPGVVGGASAGAGRAARERERDGHAVDDRRAAAPDPDGDGLARVGRVDPGSGDADGRRRQDGPRDTPEPSARAAANPNESGRGTSLADVQTRKPDPARGRVEWGPYALAVARWERALGRPAPAPTEIGAKGGQRLSPRFVEWMMGLPDGWVTAVPGLSRNDQLKALGNGVVPQQAAAALHALLAYRTAAEGVRRGA